MHHCVGSYSSNCATGGSHIFSIKDAGGIRLSTLELREQKAGPVTILTLGQNEGLCRETPCAAAKEATQWLLDALNSGAIPVDWARIEAAQLNRTSDDLCGFTVADDAAWLKRYQAMLPFLPKALAKPTPQEFLAAIAWEPRLAEAMSVLSV